MTLISDSRFVWLPEAAGRNAFVLFRRELDLEVLPDEATLHLFADSRYRLRVNGDFVASGPARFVTQFPEYDSIDVRPWLRPGRNCVTVEVNAFGASSYQTMPDQQPGFLAAGEIAGQSLATPGEWRARRLEAWDADAALLTFAQNPLEICDTQALPPEWFAPAFRADWPAPTPVAPAAAPWGELRPRTAVPFTYPSREPVRVVVRGPLAAPEVLSGFRLPESAWLGDRPLPTKWRQAFHTTIHSPRAQTVTLAVHWGDYWINGEGVRSEWIKTLGNRSDLSVTLRAGANEFSGHLEWLNSCEFWDFVLGLPVEAGLRLDAGDGAPFAVSPTMPEDQIAGWLPDGRPDLSRPWQRESGDARRLTPARVMAWDRLASIAGRDEPFADWRAEPLTGDTAVNLDFGTEYLGHIAVDIEGPAGTIVDLGYDEWLRDDGLIHLYRTNPYVNTAERFVLRGGRQEVMTFHARGGRYVQVSIRAGGSPGPVRLHGVRVLETKTTDRGAATFTCGDPLLEAIWFASTETLIGSTEDAYSDSPWRERGTYVGDFTVNQAVQRLLDPDVRTARRGLRVFAQAQLPNGQIPCVAPAFHRRPHEDFTLVWLLAVRGFWSMTGDVALVRELWPAITRLWESSAWRSHPDDEGLWSPEGLTLFVDWGILRPERSIGRANGVLNAFRFAALRGCADLATAIGHTDDAARFHAEADAVSVAFRRRLWLADEGRFAAGLTDEGLPQSTPAWHANALAWAFDIGDATQRPALEAYVLDLLTRNYAHGTEHGQFAGQLELYFLSFLLAPLAERGHAAVAENVIREHWADLVADGFGTLPECFARFRSGYGSRCHSWSGSPAVYLMQQVVGLRQATPGDPDHWIVSPRVSPAITHAEGTFPHARGLIHVRWSRRPDGTLDLRISAPKGVTVEPAPTST